MKGAVFAITGFITTLVCMSLFGSVVFYGLALSYVLALFLLFFKEPTTAGYGFLAGLTTGIELLGTTHLGQASLLTFVIVGMYYFFGLQLRFTSRFLRYIVALLLMLLLYSALLYPVSLIIERLIPVLALFIFCIPVSYFLSGSTSNNDEHEFA